MQTCVCERQREEKKKKLEDIHKSYAIFALYFFCEDIDQWKFFFSFTNVHFQCHCLYTKEVEAIESRKIADHHTSMIVEPSLIYSAKHIQLST